MLSPDDFRAADIFADQPADGLAWLAGTAEERTFADGDRPFRPGMAADEMFVVLGGAFQIFTVEGGQRLLWNTVRAGETSGLLPFSRMTHFEGEGVAVGALRLAALHRRHFPELLARMPEVGQRLVARLTDRVREASRLDEQRDRMAALGKLSAGLAHELNNPAAAIRRAASALRERLAALPPLVARLASLGLEPDALDAAHAALQTCTAPLPGTLGPLDRADREDALADWLDSRAVPGAMDLAATLADEGVRPDALDHLEAAVPADALADVVRWIEARLATDRLLADVESSAGRISGLVAAVKGYTHMDGARDRQAVSVHRGLDDTLTMLGHSVRAKNATVVRAYGDGVPDVLGYPGELNQVWTNLLDNALDAIAPGGRLELATRREGELVCVEVVDDGPGIPAEAQARVFEAFYTTKPPGAGTGLGLDAVRRIVAQHEGRVRLESRPGRTVFEVCLPVAG